MSAPRSGAALVILPGVRENQVGMPGNVTLPCGESTVSKKPTAFRCSLVNSSSGVRSGAAGMPAMGKVMKAALGVLSAAGKPADGKRVNEAVKKRLSG